MGKKIVKKIVVAGDVLFGTHNFLKQNYVQQIIIWTRRRRENRDATLYSWNIWPVSADVSFYSWFQLFSSCFQPFSAAVSWFSLTGTFAVAAAASSNNWLDLVLFLRHFSLRICMFWRKISLSQVQCLFSVKQFFDMKISLVLPEVFSFFLLPFQLYSVSGKNQSFLHGFPNNVLVALE